MELSEKLRQGLVFENKTLNVSISVKASNEESKYCVSPQATINLVRKVALLITLKTKELMTIGLFSDESEALLFR